MVHLQSYVLGQTPMVLKAPFFIIEWHFWGYHCLFGLETLESSEMQM